MRTSPGPGLGTGASVIKRTSAGPSGDVCCRARIVAGMLTGNQLSFVDLSQRGLFACRTVDHVDLRQTRKESAALLSRGVAHPGQDG